LVNLIKTILVFSIITVLIVGTFYYLIPDAEAQEDSESKPKLLPSVKKIKLVQYIGGIFPNKLPNATFSIVNFGPEPPKNLKIFVTELVNKDEIRFVGNTDRHIFNEFRLRFDENPIGMDESLHVAFWLTEPIIEEGTYEGQIQITGDNFDTIKLDLEIEAKLNPWNLLYTTIGGILFSLILGLFLTFKEKKKKFTKSYKEDPLIITHVNMHIDEWNELKDSINTNSWKILSKIFQGKEDDIKKDWKDWELEEDNENVKWFEKVSHSLFEKSLEGGNVSGNVDIGPIKIEDREKRTELESEQKAHAEAKKELLNLKQAVYIIATFVVSIPTAIFVADNFIGHHFINYLIAFGTGAAIHKVQDIRNAFFKK